MMTEQGAFVWSFLLNWLLFAIIVWQGRERAKAEDVYKKRVEQFEKWLAEGEVAKARVRIYEEANAKVERGLADVLVRLQAKGGKGE